jgi:DNA polymerase III sliding clamp (beta) subunit (PCNA family)
METKTEVKLEGKETKQQMDKLKKKVKSEIKEEFVDKPKLQLKLNSDKTPWKTLLRKVGSVQDEVALEISKEGLHTKTADKTNVAMVDLTIKKACFKEYKVSHTVKFGMNLGKLNTHMKVYGDDITVENGDNQLVFKGEKGLQSKMGLLTVIDFEMKLPEFAYSVELKAPAENIQKMVQVGKDFGQEALQFIIKDKQFFILVENETDEVRFPICAVNKLDDSGDFKSLYSTAFLENVLKFDPKDNLILKFGKDIPMLIDFEDDEHKVQYLLAPRIENDDE